MNKNELIKMVITKFASHPIIFTTGYASRIAYLLKPEAVNHFYMVGSMGMASAIGRGVASQLSDNSHCPVIVDGEGALLMGLHSLVLEQEASGKILHIIANDASYSSTGGQHIPVSVDYLSGFALAAGYGLVKDLNPSEESFAYELEMAASSIKSGFSALLNCTIEPGPEPLGRIDLPLPQIASRFNAFIEEKGSKILFL